MSPTALPIYELESDVVASLRSQGRLIVQAPTGSGKSTQIPQMLWRHGLLGDRGEVVVLQPRRLAARMLAKRVAEEAGTKLGEGVGYQIRLESRISERTRRVHLELNGEIEHVRSNFIHGVKRFPVKVGPG
jgi:ATP-dependent helicase HrpB